MKPPVVKRRILLAFLLSFALFCSSFTVHILALTPSSPDSPPASSEEAGPSDGSSEDPVSSEPPASSTNTESVLSSEAPSVVSSEPVSSAPPVSSSSSRLPPSEPESQPESRPVESSEPESLVVETVSEGGAPDNYTEANPYTPTDSYVYTGSYAGLSSDAAPGDDASSTASTALTPPATTARRYARYAKIGLAVFCLLSLGVVVCFIVFNRRVARSKKLHPEWYRKAAKRPVEEADRQPAAAKAQKAARPRKQKSDGGRH